MRCHDFSAPKCQKLEVTDAISKAETQRKNVKNKPIERPQISME